MAKQIGISRDKIPVRLYADLATSERVRAGILNTIGIVGASTLLASSVGLVQAWLIAHTDIRGKRILEGLFILPFVIPSYITSLAWARFAGPGAVATGLSAQGRGVSEGGFSLMRGA